VEAIASRNPDRAAEAVRAFMSPMIEALAQDEAEPVR
jgi:DNA-binding GntR family transcriptional regulator